MRASFLDDLLASATRRPTHLAVTDGTARLTYAELFLQARQRAAHLMHQGLGHGDRVVVVLPTGVPCAVAVYAIAMAGACFVVVDASIQEDRLASILAKTGARAVLCDTGSAPVVAAAARRAPGVLLLTDEPAGREALPPASLPPVISTDLATIVFTSGSTGEPRGATFLHRSLMFVTSAVLAYLPVASEDRILSVLPLSHTYGLYQLLLSVRVGATLHLRRTAAPVGGLLRDLREERITVVPGVPSLWQLFRSPETEPLHDVRVLSNAGAALPTDRIADLVRLFPRAWTYAMYGQTECARVAYLPPHLLATRPESVGIAMPGTQVWLEDEHGREPPAGGVGELMVRGEHVMQGYWGDEVATEHKLRPGRWPGDRVLRTGDLFRRDQDGYLYFVARRDDVINTGGEKVAPLEVERVLCSAPGVAEAVVLGSADPVLGEVVVAHVVALPGSELDVRAVRRYCAENLEASKVPRVVVERPAIPRLSSGKIDRRLLGAAPAGHAE